MITDLNKIADEWSYRVGVIDLENYKHRYHLNQILYEYGWTQEVIDKINQNLTEDDIVKNKKSGNTYVVKTHNPDTQDLVKKDASPEDIKKVDKGEEDTDTDELRNVDHKSTDKALTRKTTDPSEKGVGLGTDKSRAGEAATHKALRMLKAGKSYEQIEEYLMSIANQPDTYLDKSWVKAAISATKSIEETYGIDNVDDIVWDTPSGRKLINVEGHGTSSDMFVKLKDGTRVGISLKKDGSVFIRNGSYKATTEKLYKDLKEYGVSEEEIEKFKQKTDIKNYIEDLNKSIISAADKMKDDSVIKKMIDRAKNDPEYAKSLNIHNYVNRLDDDFFERVSGRSGKRTNSDIKVLARLAAGPEYREKNPEAYQNMRDADTRTTQRILKAIGESEEIEDAMKEDVMKGIHIDQVLGIDDDMNLDDFITVYGTTPEASQLNEKTIIDMFGGEVEQLLAEYKQNPSGELKQKIKDEIKSQIQIDYEDGAKDGTIKIKHEGPPPQEYPLFTIKSRARGIGEKPILEMAQTTFMGNALKFGLDVEKWPPRQKKAFLKSLENK